MKVQISSYSGQLPNLFEYHSFLRVDPLSSDDQDAAKKFEVESPIWAGLVIVAPPQTDPGCESIEAWTELPALISPPVRTMNRDPRPPQLPSGGCGKAGGSTGAGLAGDE
jgi:hypothetical protein